MSKALEAFDPTLQSWFQERYGSPTAVQEEAWRCIATGAHVLASAPTGTGKTLAAFLSGIDRLFRGEWSSDGAVSLLYVSPLKALNNDIRRNLTEPLAELQKRFRERGRADGEIRVATRSGDTPESERRRMVHQPPDILITTPESLNLLLSSPRGREIFRGLRCLIVDEIHAVAATKRGAHLMTAVERLTLLAGEFQRIGMSATVQPLDAVGRFLGGYMRSGYTRGGGYEPRPVELVSVPDAKRRSVRIPATPEKEDGELWPALAGECIAIIRSNRSTLFFTTNRRNAEKLALSINRRAGTELAYAHHGSLSRELRYFVEEQLKAGRLKAIVATTSLELGIDVGEIEQVVLVGSPLTASQAVQMVGRAGHRVGAESRGAIYALHGRDYLDAAVLARAVRASDTEPLQPVRAPLDVLAQIIVSMVNVDAWRDDELFHFIRCCSTYRELSRESFDAVLDMLASPLPGSSREIAPRIIYARETGTLRGAAGSLTLLYHSGGTIPDRGYYTLRSAESGARVGELDEEFVWELRVGEHFVLGSRRWRVTAITDRDVEAGAANDAANALPFWRAEPLSKSFWLAERTLKLLSRVNEAADVASGVAAVAPEHGLSEAAAERLAEFLSSQVEACNAPLPDRHHVVAELYRDPTGKDDAAYAVLHTLWGGRVNRPLSLAIAALLRKRSGEQPDLYVDNDCVMFRLHENPEIVRELLYQLPADEARLLTLIADELERTSFFGGKFRENAGRALLLPRAGFNRRTPLWMTRLRARKLLESVRSRPDFPILTETWRSCLHDEMDIPALMRVTDELAAGSIRLSICHTATPSPFARSVLWQQTNERIYDDDSPAGGAAAGDAIRRALHFAALRPQIRQESVAELVALLQRLKRGYEPDSFLALWQWTEQRVAIPIAEWQTLTASAELDLAEQVSTLTREPGPAAEEPLEVAEGGFRLLRWRMSGAESDIVTTGNWYHRLTKAAAGADASDALLGWLSYYGPVSHGFVQALFGISAETLEALVAELANRGELVTGVSVEGVGSETICTTDNLERLLRLQRRRARPDLSPRPAGELPLFLAAVQGLLPEQRSRAGADPAAAAERLSEVLDQLSCYADRAELWEQAILPARIEEYRSELAERVLAEESYLWFGAGEKVIGFAYADDLELLQRPVESNEAGGTVPAGGGVEEGAFELPASGRFTAADLAALNGVSIAAARGRLWQLAWQGRATSSSFRPVRAGLSAGFPAPTDSSAPDVTPTAAGGAGGRRRWRERRRRLPESHWRRLEPAPGGYAAADPLELAERGKEQARLLLSRYGVVCKELLEAEAPPLRWRALFESFRLLELAGEAVGGRYFDGLSGPQFADPNVVTIHRDLERLEHSAPIYWMNARDPASPCGRVGELELPPRVASTHLVYAGSTPVLVSKRNGADLGIRVEPGDERLPDCIELHFSRLLSRDFKPATRVTVETINGSPAGDSEHAPLFLSRGFRKERNSLVRWANYR